MCFVSRSIKQREAAIGLKQTVQPVFVILHEACAPAFAS